MGMNLNLGHVDMSSNGLPPNLMGPYVNISQLAASAASTVAASVAAPQDDEKIYALVIELMDAETRDTALLELSKKREQYDDLALVLWHSFGASSAAILVLLRMLTLTLRHHARVASRNRLRLSSTLPTQPDSKRVQPRLQCPCPVAMRCFSL
jgi:CCR4-NOT transcription complex subunit 9